MHRPTILSQQARGNVTVAAVVARAGQHQHSAAPEMTPNCACNGAAGSLHQLGTRVTMPCRRLVGPAHFGWGEEGGAAAQPAHQRGGPRLLAIFGRAVFWPTKTQPREHGEGLWGRVAGRLVRRPVLTLVIGVLALGGLSLFALQYKASGFGGDVSAPAGSDAAKGNAALAANFPQSTDNPTNVVMRFSKSVWQDPDQLQTATKGLQGIKQFSTLTGPLNPSGNAITPSELTSIYNQVHTYGSAQDLVTQSLTPPAGSGISTSTYDTYLSTARFISADGSTVQWEAGLSVGTPGSDAAISAVPAIRTQVDQVASQAGANDSGVAGEAPALYDVSNISNSDVKTIVPIAVLAIGFVLALVLRSLVAPIYLILSVVLSYLASLGISVLVFMTIGGQEGLVFLLPFLMFIFLLALGEDYNILVMTRIREEAKRDRRDKRDGLRRAVVRAVGATGPTVTSAGLVLAGSFVVLAVVGGSGQGNEQIRVIGFGLAVGILIDTFVVRTVLVPSIVELLGRGTGGRPRWAASRPRMRDTGPSGCRRPADRPPRRWKRSRPSRPSRPSRESRERTPPHPWWMARTARKRTGTAGERGGGAPVLRRSAVRRRPGGVRPPDPDRRGPGGDRGRRRRLHRRPARRLRERSSARLGRGAVLRPFRR